MLTDKQITLRNAIQTTPKCFLILENKCYTEHIFRISALVFLFCFLQILGISVILRLHAIMECKDKVAKCLKTSLEGLTIHRHICIIKKYNI